MTTIEIGMAVLGAFCAALTGWMAVLLRRQADAIAVALRQRDFAAELVLRRDEQLARAVTAESIANRQLSLVTEGHAHAVKQFEKAGDRIIEIAADLDAVIAERDQLLAERAAMTSPDIEAM